MVVEAVRRPRSTLSLLITTAGVAVTSLVGLSQAAASVPVSLDSNAAAEPSMQRATGVVDTGRSAQYTGDLHDEPNMNVILGRFQPMAPTDGSSVGGIPTNATSSTTSTTTRSTATPDPMAPDHATAVDVRTPPPTSDDPTPTTPSPPMTSPERQWRTISSAEFRRFVDSRQFTTTEFITPNLVHGTFAGGRQSVNVVLVHRSKTLPMRVSPEDRAREPVGAWARALGATAGVNANWYGPFDGPAVSEGNVYGGADHGYTALFGFTGDGDLVADHHHKVHDGVDPRVVEGVSGHPTLIHRGSVTVEFGHDPTFDRRHPRTALGVTASIDVLMLVTIDGRRNDAVGMTATETAELLARLGAHDAVMLDGGGSSAMWIAGRGIVNRPADPGRAVGNQIAVFGG